MISTEITGQADLAVGTIYGVGCQVSESRVVLRVLDILKKSPETVSVLFPLSEGHVMSSFCRNNTIIVFIN